MLNNQDGGGKIRRQAGNKRAKSMNTALRRTDRDYSGHEILSKDGNAGRPGKDQKKAE